MNKLISITFLSLLLSGCFGGQYLSKFAIKPYTADIRQGSVLEQANIDKLQIGLSKQQVRDLLGSPSVIDPFHNNQWDYIHYTKFGSGKITHYRLTLTFNEDVLADINTKELDALSDKKSEKN